MRASDDVRPAHAAAGGAGAGRGMRPEWTWRTIRWWPTLVAIALAAFIAIDVLDGPELAPVLAASGFVYLAAAALGRARAWPLFLGTFVIIGAARSGFVDFDPTWVLLGLSVVFAGYGLVRGATRPFEGMPLQAIAMVAVATAAAIAVVVDGALGAYLVAAGLLGHAAWDVYHHRVDRIVTRSMAEFCGVLDTLLAVALLIAVVRG